MVTGRHVGWLALALVAACSAAAVPPSLEVISPDQARQALAVPNNVAITYFEGVRLANLNEDPLQRCLLFPDLPGNHWPAQLAKAHCELAFGSGINAKRMATMLDSGKVEELEAIYAADQERHFSKSNFSEAIHGDFHFFDGGKQSDRLSRQWLGKAKDSPYAMLARANHLLNAARRVRRARSEGKMADDEIASMRQLGQESAALYASAAKKAPNMIEAYNGLAHVGTIAGLGEAELSGIEEGKKVDALCAALAMQEMWALMPRWGGSQEAMRGRSAELAKSLNERPLVSLAMAMPDYDLSDQMCCSHPNSRFAMGDLLRPLALVTTNPDVSENLGTATCCGASGSAMESTVHFLAASRFRRSTTFFAMQRAMSVLQNYPSHPEIALPDIQYVLDWEPDNGHAHVKLAEVYYMQRRYADAEKELLIGLDDPTARSRALMILAQTLAMEGRLDQARARADQFKQEFPEDAQISAWLDSFLASQAAASQPN
ncbi:MAG: hypothetical protein A3E01_06680 [Gammaproteobacteria bacterium RIFCSPHIGHO2_12_FULL_63_22]|nr:MAG: hypothetical protein A3E01_06680 [Gammaproteobacteria bacterium RIFCSPHIGHO2_12_FULL_63_22]